MKSRLLLLAGAVPVLWLLFAARLGTPTATADDAGPAAYAATLALAGVLLAVVRLADRAPFSADPGLRKVAVAVEAGLFLVVAAGAPGLIDGEMHVAPTLAGSLLGGVAVSALAAARAEEARVLASERRRAGRRTPTC